MDELTEDFEILIVAWLKSDDENATNLAHSLAKHAEKALAISRVVSSKILIDKKELLELTTKAIKEGFNSYEIVDSGLESFDAEAMARWIISKYV